MDINELKSFLACNFFMGLIHKFALENYWNMKDLIQEIPNFHHIKV